MKKDIYILGIESSCDETSAAVVKNSRECLSNVIASQIEIHRRFGGVVPEIAGRNHLLAVMPVVDEALAKAGIGMKDLDAVAVTYGAGLIGCLLVGVSAAKAIAYALGIPLIAVNHIQGHIAANFIAFPDLQPPLLSLVASGGHTSIIAVEDYNTYKSISATLDDAIGESFDKVARILGLPYPGGPEIDRHGRNGKANIERQSEYPFLSEPSRARRSFVHVFGTEDGGSQLCSQPASARGRDTCGRYLRVVYG